MQQNTEVQNLQNHLDSEDAREDVVKVGEDDVPENILQLRDKYIIVCEAKSQNILYPICSGG